MSGQAAEDAPEEEEVKDRRKKTTNQTNEATWRTDSEPGSRAGGGGFAFCYLQDKAAQLLT